MKKLLLLLITSFTIISCSETVDAEKIPWTSTSDEAKVLFDKFLNNREIRRANPDDQEKLMNSILKLDPNFALGKINFSWGWPNTTREETRKNLLSAYDDRENVSDLEKRLIIANFEAFINGNGIRFDEILDSLANDYPQYYQLRLWSGTSKNDLQNPKAAQKRWEEALEINPKSFSAYVNLSLLHFQYIDGFTLLAPADRDLEKAISLLQKGKKEHPNSSRWARFLGNIYRSQAKMDKAEEAYKEAADIVAKSEDGPESRAYAEMLYLIAHVKTFKGEYDEGRDYYEQSISWLQNNNVINANGIGQFYAHTYIYQKDFAKAIYYISELQSNLDDFDVDEIVKTNYNIGLEFTKFLAFGHSQKQEETLASIEKMKSLREFRLKRLLEDAFDENQKNRLNLSFEKQTLGNKIWYNILFGKYEEAGDLLLNFKIVSDSQLSYNPNALNDYYKFSGYLNLMEGNPQESIDSYSNLADEILSDDNYHLYFLALAKKALGQTDESDKMFNELANNNFATWQNAIVKNLAKSQIKVNI
jgi:hypothetical protein